MTYTKLLTAALFSFLLMAPKAHAQEPVQEPIVLRINMPYQPIGSSYRVLWVLVDGQIMPINQPAYQVTIDDVNGQIYGQVCNRFRGSFHASMGGDLAIGPLLATKMACVALADENAILQAMEQASQFRLEGDTLFLLHNSQVVLALQKNNADMTNPTSPLQSIANQPLLIKKVRANDQWLQISDTSIALQYDKANNRIAGKAGCNRFFGNAHFAAGQNATMGTLQVGPLGSTMMACGEWQETETAIFEALGTVNEFSITGKTLSLSRDGELIMQLELA